MAEKEKFADEMLIDDELEQVAGGSFRVSEDNAKKAGIYLLKEDGTPGEWGNLWNTGDYYFGEEKITQSAARCIVTFYNSKGRRSYNSTEAVNYCKNHKGYVKRLP
ncbi:MAG: hypothetical protein SR3Q1_00280 [Quinella sp. 3Q1]|nr:hypothetical protein [Quinella sp. 3Q1]